MDIERAKKGWLGTLDNLLFETKTGKAAIVYFVRVVNKDGFIKIGQTNNLEKRWQSITDSPYDIEIVSSFVGTVRHEKLLHKLLEKSHLRGEWFYPNEEVLAAAEHCKGRNLLTEKREGIQKVYITRL
jgi:hypothetical protein